LHSSTIGNSLIRVDGFVWLFSVEEVLEELLNLGDAGRATDEYDLVDLVL
jgi:hypothetical protein